jgi:O-antigen/teichoic acid export membrane protein
MSFFPSWLFQGMERMGGMAALSTGARLVQLGLILALIRNPGDVGLALWISAGVSLASTLAAWILALNNFSIRLEFPSPRRVLDVLRNGFEIFISQAGTLLFANTNVMMLAAFATPEAVGMYAIAEKLVRVCIQIGYPIGTVLYPRVAILMQESRIEAFRFLRKILAWGSLGFLGIGILLVVAAPMAVRFICGHPEPDILPLVLILSPLPLTIFMDNIFGVQVVLNSGHRRAFMTVPLIAGLISVVLQWLLIRPFGATGAALSLLLSECFILVLFAILAKKLTEFSVFSARMPGP